MRAQKPKGSVVFNNARATWNYLWLENGRRRSRKLGTIAELPTRPDAEKKADVVRRDLRLVARRTIPTVRQLVEQYRTEKMPRRASTRRGYESWLANYVLPRWGDSVLTDVQARPVELWLQPLTLSPKSKVHIRGVLNLLWDYAMWCGYIVPERNPMSLVTIRGAGKRTRKPRSLTVDEFHSLLGRFKASVCFRTMLLLLVSFGLRVSELLGLKWKDIDWLNRTLRIERGMVRQTVDDVKTKESAQAMTIADELLDVLKVWRQSTEFSADDDWMFASPVKLGRQPFSYTHVLTTICDAAREARVGPVGTHTFRHTYRTWLDAVGTPVGVQQKLMRHADIRTTMNIYGDAVTEDMRLAHEKVVQLAISKGMN